jgi:chemotaxis protein CheZ
VVSLSLIQPCLNGILTMSGLRIVKRLSGVKMTHSRKTFTIEKSMSREVLPEEQGFAPFESSGSIPEAADIRRVLAKLDELGAMLLPTQSIVSSIAEAYRREVVEVMKLREEMEIIQTAIRETKRQVVSLHTAAPRAVNMHHAAGELGAVVHDTEGATNSILAAAERIEILAGVIQSETTKDGMKKRAGEIAAVVMSVYEACNFQDLTGQRITRVCETLNFVEGRVGRMAEIWGGLDSLSSIMASEIEALNEERSALGTHALAAGPALAGEDGQIGHVGQDDIDALFD